MAYLAASHRDERTRRSQSVLSMVDERFGVGEHRGGALGADAATEFNLQRANRDHVLEGEGGGTDSEFGCSWAIETFRREEAFPCESTGGR